MSKKLYMDIIFIVVCVCMTLTKYAKCTTLGQGYELGKKITNDPCHGFGKDWTTDVF